MHGGAALVGAPCVSSSLQLWCRKWNIWNQHVCVCRIVCRTSYKSKQSAREIRSGGRFATFQLPSPAFCPSPGHRDTAEAVRGDKMKAEAEPEVYGALEVEAVEEPAAQVRECHSQMFLSVLLMIRSSCTASKSEHTLSKRRTPRL